MNPRRMLVLVVTALAVIASACAAPAATPAGTGQPPAPATAVPASPAPATPAVPAVTARVPTSAPRPLSGGSAAPAATPVPTFTAGMRPPGDTPAPAPLTTTPTATSVTADLPSTPTAAAPVTARPAPRLQAGETIQPPLLVDGEHGHLFALLLASADGARRIGVFSARDGSLAAIYEDGGPLALDATAGRLFVDRGAAGLAVLDAASGETLHVFNVPGAVDPVARHAAPQFDPAAGQVLVFRGPTVHALDAATGQVVRSVSFDLRPQDGCRVPHDALLPIVRTYYDPAGGLLYLDFETYVCTPYVGYTNVSVDWPSGVEIARQGSTPYNGLAAPGRFYASSWYRMGIGTLWTERSGRPETVSTGWNYGSGFVHDGGRDRLYQAADGSLQIFDAGSMTLLAVVPQPAEGAPAGYDGVTDQLYFTTGRSIIPWPAADLEEPRVAAAAPAAPPGQPVRLILPSPAWATDATLLAVWESLSFESGCYVFNQTGGTLLRSTDGAHVWSAPVAGLPTGCGLSALALSPDYARDRTALAGVKGHGVFLSRDGGLSWLPAGAGLPHMGVTAVAFSPGFAADRTVFTVVQESPLLRSVDGAASWQALDTARPVALLSLSPEFDRDGIAVLYAGQPGLLQISQDRGDHWRSLEAALPGSGALRLVSLAPAYARWQVLFALDSAGDLHRSADGGRTWQQVLATAADAGHSRIVYGPSEEQRPVFLLVSGTRYSEEGPAAWGRLYRSTDGGLSWSELDAGGQVVPTALAISPAFEQDGMIFVGTSDGRVLSLRVREMAGRTGEVWSQGDFMLRLTTRAGS